MYFPQISEVGGSPEKMTIFMLTTHPAVPKALSSLWKSSRKPLLKRYGARVDTRDTGYPDLA